jgi:hypothetical protein
MSTGYAFGFPLEVREVTQIFSCLDSGSDKIVFAK